MSMLLTTLLLAAAPIEIPEVEVLGQPYVTQTVDSITARRIAQVNPLTTADLLAGEGALAVQKSQLGGGSPMIRGFEASRVLLSVDGVRMNNLIYRAGHLQNVISIDPTALERADVLYGPASVGYGSDALGGVMAFRTKAPKLNHTGGSSMIRFNTNPALTLHTDLNLGGERFASFTSLTLNGSGNLHCGHRRNPFRPDGEEYIHRGYRIDGTAVNFPTDGNIYDHALITKKHRQWGSGYTQFDLLQRFHYQSSAEVSHGVNVQFSTTSDVDRYDRLTDLTSSGDLKFAEWYYGPQKRLLAAYTLTMADFTATVAYQNVHESRHNRKLNDPWLGHRREKVNVLSLTTDWSRAMGQHHIHAGIDGALQWLRSTADKENLCTGAVKPLDTRYPGGHNYQHNIDLYMSHTWRFAPGWQLADGVRVGYNRLRAEFTEGDYGTVIQSNFTYSLSAGVTYFPVSDWRLGIQLSTGYRVPNIDDMAKVFDSQPGMVVVPNPHLKPEQTVGVDINAARLSAGALQWRASVWGTYMFHAIGLGRATVGGQSVIDYDGEPSHVYANRNNRRAFVAGVTFSLTLRLLRYFSVDASASYAYGNYFGLGEPRQPLDHVAPLYGRVGLTFEHNRVMAEFYSLWNGRKPLSRYNLNGEDNLVYATPSGMPAWYTLNLRASWRLSRVTTLQGAVENLLDIDYRTFASGINAPGRNILITLRLDY